MLKTLLLLISLLTPSVNAQATGNSYYIATNGNDGNNGSVNSPLKTFSKAQSLAVSGDTIYFRSGTYPSFNVTKSNISVAGFNSERPVITGGEGINLNNVSNVNLSNFEVTGNSHSWRGGITITGGGNNIIQNNIAHNNIGTGTSGIRVWNSSNNKILSNDVYRNTFGGIDITAEGGNSTGNEIGFNKAHDHTLSGGDSDGMGGNTNGGQNTGNIYHDNVVYNNSDDGIDTWNTSGNTITNNISYSNGWDANHNSAGDGNGIKVGGSTTGGNNLVTQNISYSNRMDGFASNGNGNKFYNNTSYGNGQDGFNDGWRTSGSTYLKSEFVNNIGMNNGRNNAYFSSDTSISSNNIWYSSGGPKVSGSKAGFSDLSVDPLFIDPSSGQFGLKANSPAISGGIGAIEYGGNSVPPTKPTTNPAVKPTIKPTIKPTAVPVINCTSNLKICNGDNVEVCSNGSLLSAGCGGYGCLDGMCITPPIVSPMVSPRPLPVNFWKTNWWRTFLQKFYHARNNRIYK